MKHDKGMPVYYQITAEDGSAIVVKASLIGITGYMREHEMPFAQVNSVQKVSGKWEIVEGRSRVIINAVIYIDPKTGNMI